MNKQVSRKTRDAASEGEAKPAGRSLVRLNFIPLRVSVLASGYVAYVQFISLLSRQLQESHEKV